MDDGKFDTEIGTLRTSGMTMKEYPKSHGDRTARIYFSNLLTRIAKV